MSAAVSQTESAEAAPVHTIRVVRGNPTPEELAAVVAVIAAGAGGDGGPGTERVPSRWADRGRAVRTPLQPGRGGWRASALPVNR